MKLIIMSPNDTVFDCTKFCLIGIQIGDTTFGITLDWGWSE